MYHGANSFAKENYRETIHAGIGCNHPVPGNRGASKSGREPRSNLYPRRLHLAGVRKELRRGSDRKRFMLALAAITLFLATAALPSLAESPAPICTPAGCTLPG